jgi:hypothetical protein
MLDLLEDKQYIPEPQDGTVTGMKPRSRQDCRRNGQGRVDYGDVDQASGWRATGVEACLDSAYLTQRPGTPTQRGITPAGYEWARNYVRYLGGKASGVNACHLLGAQLGGSGTQLANPVTCGTDANSYVGKPKQSIAPMDSMLDVEDRLRAYVDSQHVVHYQVTPL